MKMLKAAAAGALLLLLPPSNAAAEVTLSIRDGRVTLVAANATVRQILAEWARVGQTKIVNVERIPGAPLTLQLTNMPEQEALDFLLRSVTGYMAAERPVAAANLSRYDRILVLPTAAVARVPAAAAPTPVFQQPAAQPRPFDPNDDSGPSVQPARGPLFPVIQQPPGAQPGQRMVIENPVGGAPPGGGATATPGAVYTAPPGGSVIITGSTPGTSTVGTPRPGMVVPVQPGIVVQPQQPVPSPDN